MTLSANALEGREESPPWNTADGDNPPPPLMLAWTSPPPAAQLSAVLTKPWPNDAKMAAVLLCDVLGALCILLNAFVIVALIRNRRRVLVNVFYVLVLHCAIVDLIRGGCLIAWGMPHLLIHTMHSIQDRLLALKINQFTLVILRSCNLLTIFNLLVFTTNEFIVIKYPLHYRRYFRRRTVLIILAMCWMVSLLFGVGSVFSNFFESAHSVMVHSNGTTLFRRRMMAAARQRELDDREETAAEEEDGEEEEEDSGGGEGTVPTQPNGVTRRQMDGLSINVLCMLMIFVLCYVCLFTVLICYGKILRTIRRFQRCGSDGQRRVMSAIGESQKSSGASAFGRTNSIYHKRSMHQQRTQQHQQTTCQSAPAPPPMAAVRVHQQQHPAVQQAKEESALERCNSVRKKASMPGTPQSGASAAHCGRCPNCTANATADDQLGKSRRCNSHRKWRSHLMSRHKYLIVIGTVLFVDVLFLFPYSGIQMVALLHLNNLLATSHLTTLIRWGLQILIGVHSVCQPLCYFRMTEFRRLACCLGGTGPRRRFMGSGSSGAGGSIFGGGGVGASRSAKYPADSMPKAGCGGGGGADPKVDEGEEPIRKKRSIVLSTLVDEGTPPSGRILEDGRHKLVNPSVGERQMLLIAQRRRWTRNLSLLCKEEGEELEVFLGRAYRHRGDEEGGKSANARQWKGSSLRERDREGPAAADGSTERAGQERGGSDGQLLGAAQQRMVQIASRRAAVDEEQIEEEEASANGSGAALKEPQQWARMREKLLLVEEGDGGTRVPQKDKSRGGGFGALLGRLGIGRRRAHSEDDGREQCSPIGHTFLERNWKRAGGAEMVQFRMYGAQKEANDHVHLQPKLSGLSGLRSNSVFTNSTVQSRHASAQWENNNNI